MELRQLHHFVAVIDAGGFARASKTLGLTQQALSSSVAKLEGSLGNQQVFDRSVNGARLTALGEVVERYARAILSDTDRMKQEAQRFHGAPNDELRLGFGEGISGVIAPRAIHQLIKAMPGTKVSVFGGVTVDLLKRVETGDLDLVAGAPPPKWNLSSSLRHDFLCEITEKVLVSRKHPLVRALHNKAPSLAELQKYTWIFPPNKPELFSRFCQAFVRAGLKIPEPIVWCDSIGIGMSLLMEYNYITLAAPEVVPTAFFKTALTMLNVRELEAPMRAYLSYRPIAALTPVTALMMSSIRDAAVATA